jgi:microcystin-dependent protein
MALETASYINGLNAANPPGSDRVHQGDDHIRLLKQAIKNTFPNITGPVTLTQDQLNGVFSGSVPVGAINLWYGADTAVPTGWTICNGVTVPRTTGTGTITPPDLRGKVPIGAQGSTYVQGQSYGAATVSGATASGGGATITGSTSSAGEHDHGTKTGAVALSEAQIPSHWHGMADHAVRNVPIPSDANSTLAWSNGNDPGEEEYELAGSGNQNAPLGRSGTKGGGEAHDHTISPSGGHTHTTSIAVPAHAHNVVDIPVIQPSLALHYIMKT